MKYRKHLNNLVSADFPTINVQRYKYIVLYSSIFYHPFSTIYSSFTIYYIVTFTTTTINMRLKHRYSCRQRREKQCTREISKHALLLFSGIKSQNVIISRGCIIIHLAYTVLVIISCSADLLCQWIVMIKNYFKEEILFLAQF